MLQQTRVETVIPYFERFLSRFPTPLALAEAPEDVVLAAWSGLGYYRRARMLHAGAKQAAEHGMPGNREGLRALPGIGAYTSGAIASIAYGEQVGLVDGNVARVLARLFAIDEDMRGKGMRTAEALADRLVPKERAGDFNQALMELGATVCTPRSPACARCPLVRSCQAHAQERVNELPVLSEKKKPKTQRVQAIVARSKTKVLLVRRKSEGLFGGLWEPPALEGKTPDELAKMLGVTGLESRGRVVHVLSHRRLEIDVHEGKLSKLPKSLPAVYEQADWFDKASIETPGEIGLATLSRKILQAVSSAR